jgi:hypothetical protein
MKGVIMPDDSQTQNGSAVATPPASSDGGRSTTGSDSSQPSGQGTGNSRVDSGTDGSRNSDRGDTDDGGDGNGNDRVRSPRVERRVSQLTSTVEQTRKDNLALAEENDRLREMLDDPIDKAKVASGVNIPDRSRQASISMDDYKNDVVSAATAIADSIVKQRLAETLTENNKRLRQSDFTSRALDDMSAVTDPDSPGYVPALDQNSDDWDEDLDKEIADDWNRLFKADPTYRFKDHVKKYVKRRGGRTQNNTNNSDSSRSRGSAALRQTGGTGKSRAVSDADIAKMTADQYKTYLQSQR